VATVITRCAHGHGIAVTADGQRVSAVLRVGASGTEVITRVGVRGLDISNLLQV
jgi:hypothetical protein